MIQCRFIVLILIYSTDFHYSEKSALLPATSGSYSVDRNDSGEGRGPALPVEALLSDSKQRRHVHDVCTSTGRYAP